MDFASLVVGIACVLSGLFIIAAIAFRWDWYVNHPWVKDRSEVFGECRATKHQIGLGWGLVILGVLMIGWFIVQVMR